MTSAPSSTTIDLSKNNEVMEITRWDVKTRKKPSYKTAVVILSNIRKAGSPSLSKMLEWFDSIVNQPSKDFFVRNFEQARSFSDLKKASISGCSSKAARYRKWTLDFVTDKIALLLELNVEERRAREIAFREVGESSTTDPAPPEDEGYFQEVR
jgi:hypothetical protein